MPARNLERDVLECIALRNVLCKMVNVNFVPYQVEASDKIIKSTLKGSCDEIVLLWARQSGKTETVVMTVLALCLYHIKRLIENFRVGIFAPAQSQSVIVTRERLMKYFKKLRSLFEDQGIRLDLGVGRTTELSILTNVKEGCEARIRAMSADETAHIMGETFNLIVVEQTEEVDESKLLKDIFPMAVATGAPRILSGTPSLGICNKYFYEVSTRNPSGSYISTVNHKVAGEYREAYRRSVDREKRRVGEESDEFKTQYGVEWIVQRSRLIDRYSLILLEEPYTSNPESKRFGGIDVAKQVDFTVATLIERSGEEHHILSWVELQGRNYEDQADILKEFFASYKPDNICVDSTGPGDPTVDLLTNRLKGIAEVEGIPSTQKNLDTIYKRLERELLNGRIHYPPEEAISGEEQKRCRRRFIEQMIDVEKVYEGNFLNLKAPSRRGCHDDYVSSLALALQASLKPRFIPGFAILDW